MAGIILLMVLVINGAVISGGGRHCEGGDSTDNLGSGGPGDGSVDVSSSSDGAQITLMVETAVMMVLMKMREIALMTVVAAGMTTVMTTVMGGLGGISYGDGRRCKLITTVLRGKGPEATGVASWRILTSNSWKENLNHN